MTIAQIGSAKVAAIQCHSGDDIDKNKASLERLITQAALQGAKLVLIPEMCLCMDGAQYQAMAQDTSLNTWLSKQASTNDIWLFVGAVPQSSPDGDPRVRSALLVFNPKGEQIARYDKIHLFDVDVGDAHSRYRESERFAPGTDIVVVDTPFGNVGLSICFDVRFPEHYLALRNAGAEILLVPAAFTYTTGKAHWEVLLRARAIEQQCYVIAANQCGWHDDKRQTWGHSMVIDPWGDVMAQLNDTPGVVVVEIDLKGVAQRRAAMPLR
jgi:predicted amidohydrolase